MRNARPLLPRWRPFMRRTLFLAVCTAAGFGGLAAQDVIEWDGIRRLELSDFRSPATQIGSGNLYSLQSAAGFDFLFQMSQAEFMFTKNFNGKVSCTFRPEASALVAPDSTMASQLLSFARYEFDLYELYARKFRKRISAEKGAFSSASFFRPAYDELQRELVTRHSLAASETDLGRNEAELQARHEAVLADLAVLKDFCKACKPPREGR
jgi:hypothetical protein